jgi:hypothetical protein
MEVDEQAYCTAIEPHLVFLTRNFRRNGLPSQKATEDFRDPPRMTRFDTDKRRAMKRRPYPFVSAFIRDFFSFFLVAALPRCVLCDLLFQALWNDIEFENGT